MKSLGRILVVDDEATSRTSIGELLRQEGYATEIAADAFKALPKLEELAPDVLLTDLHMPGMSGLDLMQRSLEQDRDRPVIVMTSYGAIDTAVAAMKQGAFDYLQKPLNLDELVLVVERALERRRLRAETGQLKRRLSERHRLESLVGTSSAMQSLFDMVLQVAPSRASVLITGESGTGKELVAAAIHEHSPRAGKPFVKLHCAALAETLLESELFGHERGAFTGAVGRRDGRFQQADKGTLFLDEIGEISPAIQVKLLRFLQEHEFERVGGNQTIKVDVRVIAATNRDLAQQVRDGHFREDLYYRLNVVALAVPPLRVRRDDIGPLARHFVQRFAKENGKSIAGLDAEALRALERYPWPGNVRELENAIERATVICRGELIKPEDLPPQVTSFHAEEAEGSPIVPGSTLAEIERYAILRTLEHVGGSTSRAAEMLGVSTRTIQYRLRELEGGPREGPPEDEEPADRE